MKMLMRFDAAMTRTFAAPLERITLRSYREYSMPRPSTRPSPRPPQCDVWADDIADATYAFDAAAAYAMMMLFARERRDS